MMPGDTLASHLVEGLFLNWHSVEIHIHEPIKSKGSVFLKVFSKALEFSLNVINSFMAKSS